MRHHDAFTLLELLIALVISVIMVTLAYPSYIHYQANANRNHAEVTLMELAARLEDYFTDNNSYQNVTENDLHLHELENDLPYRLVLASVSDQHFIIQAVPRAIQAARDGLCGTLSLTDTALRTISGNGNVDECWK